MCMSTHICNLFTDEIVSDIYKVLYIHICVRVNEHYVPVKM